MKNILYFLGLIFFVSCTKREIPDDHYIPQPFNFVITNKLGETLITDPAKNLKIWYEVNGEKKILDDLKIKPAINSNKYPFYGSSLSAAFLSLENVKQFYVSINNGEIDEIYLEVKKVLSPKGTKYVQVRFNNVPISLDFDHKPELYVLQRN